MTKVYLEDEYYGVLIENIESLTRGQLLEALQSTDHSVVRTLDDQYEPSRPTATVGYWKTTAGR